MFKTLWLSVAPRVLHQVRNDESRPDQNIYGPNRTDWMVCVLIEATSVEHTVPRIDTSAFAIVGLQRDGVEGEGSETQDSVRVVLTVDERTD
jgi:hypothetical protein